MGLFDWGNGNKKDDDPVRDYYERQGFDPARCPECKRLPKPEDVQYSLIGKAKAYCRKCNRRWVY